MRVAQLKRESLKFDSRVRAVLLLIWQLYDEDGNGMIDVDEYVASSTLVQKCLLERFKVEECGAGRRRKTRRVGPKIGPTLGLC